MFLPAATVLEIAPGFGRWTNFLAAECDRYLGVDLSQKCIQACRARFSEPHLEFFHNDGASLKMVEDSTVDFVFSHFSLIHAEDDVMAAYLGEIARVLKPEGGGFLHHSNLGEYATYFERVARLPGPVRSGLHHLGWIDLPQWRAPSMSAERFRTLCETSGLICRTQELVNFGSRRLIDCFSTFVGAASPLARAPRIWRNRGFMHEALRVRLRAEGGGAEPSGESRALPGRYYEP